MAKQCHHSKRGHCVLDARCVACDAPLIGHKRARHDVVGRWMCSKHGQASQSYAKRWLPRVCPRLAMLLADKPTMRWVLQFTISELIDSITRFKDARPIWLCRDVMPYYNPNPSRVPPRTVDVPEATHCGVRACGQPLGSRKYCFGNLPTCVSCWWRMQRQHTAAAKRFDQLFAVCQAPETRWLRQLLHPTLRKRIRRHAETASLTRLSIDRNAQFI